MTAARLVGWCMAEVQGRRRFGISDRLSLVWRYAAFALVALISAIQTVSAAAETGAIPTAKVLPDVVSIPLVRGDDIRFRRLSLSQGLSQTRVSQILQDDAGYMWFGTQHGVNRFDGHSYKVFKNDPDDGNSLSGVFIYALFKSRDGTIWVGSDQGLDGFDRTTESFRHFRVDDPNPVVIHISEDPEGSLWLSTSAGLYRLDPSTGQTRRFVHDASDAASLSSSDIKSTGFDRAGVFWVANAQGLEAFDRASGQVTMRIPLKEAVREFYFHEDRTGTLWIVHGSGNGIATYDRTKNELTRYSFYSDKKTDTNLTGVYAILETHDGTLWFATMGAGLLRFDREHNRFISYQTDPSNSESIAENRVIALNEDAEGNVWVGLHATPPNFFPIVPPTFRALKPSTPFSNAFGESLVNTILRDSRGRIWLGAGGALTIIDPATEERRFVDPQASGSPIEILSIREAPDGTIWAGSLGAGLYQMTAESAPLKTFRHDPSDPSSIASDIVTRLHFARDGTLWVATWNGLLRYDAQEDAFITYKRDPSASAEAYFSIAEQKDGLLWLGSTNGLHSFQPETGEFRQYTHDPEDASTLSNNTVNTVHIDGDGAIWVGTQNGLNRFDTGTGKFTRYYQKDGLAGSAVSCILEARDGDLWMSTNQGVSRLNRSTLQIDNYSSADGLPGNDLTGWNACYASPDGEMLFGGFSGAALVRPDALAKDAFVPPVVFTELRVEDQPIQPGTPLLPDRAISYTENLVLPYDQNSFSLQFSALSFSNPETHRYRYRLLGLDDDWHDAADGRRDVSYYSVPHGDYRLEVQASTSRGPWLDPPAGLDITVLPPWWDSWWFRTLYIATALLLLAALYRYRVQQVARHYNIRVEERVNERTRIARELHDSLLQGLHGLLFSLQAARDLLPKHVEKSMALIDTALERGDQAILDGRNAVRDLRQNVLVETDLPEALGSLQEELSSLSSGKPPSLEFFVQGRRRSIQPLVRDEIYRIAREALRNAFMHASAKSVECELHYADRQFSIRIRDDGRGMQQKLMEMGARQGHWGLPGMRERAEALGGRLELWSAPGQGTEVEIQVPAANAYS